MRPWLLTALPATLAALALVLPGTHAMAGPATPTAWVEATLGPLCELSGGTEPGQKLTITHRSASGVKKAVYKVQGDENSEWTATCTSKGIRSGDRLVITTRPDGAKVRTVTIPGMALTVNRATETVSGVSGGGVGPGVSSVNVTQCDNWNCSDGFGVGVETDAKDRFAEVMPQAVDGRDKVLLGFVNSKDDEFLLEQIAPTLSIRRGGAGVSGNARRPGAKVTVTVTRGAIVGRFTGTAGPDGSFEGRLLRNGQAFKVVAGDRVTSSIATDLDFIIPAGALGIAGNTLTGTCYPDEQVVVASVAPDRSSSTTSVLTAGGDGTFSTPLLMPSGNVVTVTCDPGEGDAVVIRKVVP
jgi:hypothetical protein